MKLFALAAGLVLAGCSLSVEFEDKCTSADDCDAPQVCTEGLCHSNTFGDITPDMTETPDLGVADMYVAVDMALDMGGATAIDMGADMGADMAVPDMAVPDMGPPSTLLELVEPCHTIHGVDPEVALAENTILFGLLMPSTGGLGGVGPPISRGAFLAVDEINQTGGVLGKRFALVECDTGTDAEQAVDAAQWLIDVAKVPAIIGPAASSSTVRVFNEVAFASNTLVISPSSTSPAITHTLDNDLLWRTAPSDATQGSAIAAHLMAQGYNKIAVVNRDDTYGHGLQAAIRGPLCDMNRCGELDYFTRSYAVDDPDAQALVLFALRDFDPDVVVVVSFVDDGVHFINLAVEAGVDRFVLSDGAKDVALIEQIENTQVLRDIIGTAPSSPAGQTYQDFTNRYLNKWGVEPGVYNSQAYDAMYVLAFGAAAIVDQEDLTGPNLANALARLSEGADILVGTVDWNRGVAALRAEPGATIDFAGASGPLDFDANGEAAADIEAWHFDVDAERTRSLGVMYTADGTYIDVTPVEPGE